MCLEERERTHLRRLARVTRANQRNANDDYSDDDDDDDDSDSNDEEGDDVDDDNDDNDGVGLAGVRSPEVRSVQGWAADGPGSRNSSPGRRRSARGHGIIAGQPWVHSRPRTG